jgi:hypothetical protein
MSTQPSLADAGYRRDLGDGLVLRWSTAEDLERVARLYMRAFTPGTEPVSDWREHTWTIDMFSGRHPHIGPGDFAVVEDTHTGAAVAATCLLGNRCEFEGIAFPFGRPEMVATLAEYRHRGLVRALFELIHARSDGRGDLVQGITGIPYFYRLFGYEYAATLDDGPTVYFAAVPALKPGATEPYTLRAATPDDVPLLSRLWARTHTDAAVWTVMEDEYWRWSMVGTHSAALQRWYAFLIVAADDHVVGALVIPVARWDATMSVYGPMLDDGARMTEVLPSVLRGLQTHEPLTKPERPSAGATAGAVTLRWCAPTVRAGLGDIPYLEPPDPYAWYLRVPDLPRFLRHVAPALERRLAESPYAGNSGEITLDFYRGGLRLVLEDGRLVTIEDWRRPVDTESKAGFPPLVFLQMLFGHRSLRELRGMYPDVRAAGDVAPILDALFPKRRSQLLVLD